MYYKWIGMFVKMGSTVSVTLKMKVSYKRYAEANVIDKMNEMLKQGYVLSQGQLFRTTKDYKPV